MGKNLEVTAKTLIAMGKHPNLTAVLVVGLDGVRIEKRFLEEFQNIPRVE